MTAPRPPVLIAALLLAVAPADAPAAIESLNAAGEQAFDVGEVVVRPDGAAHAIIA